VARVSGLAVACWLDVYPSFEGADVVQACYINKMLIYSSQGYYDMKKGERPCRS
jgi:hypothetical protein